MRCPDIQQYSSVNQFLKDFYHFNKKDNAKASFRFFAQKLKWPVSYLNDVIKNRKKLTMKRTLELGSYLKFDSVNMERLIFLSLKQSEDKQIFEYFSDKLNEEFNSQSYFPTRTQQESIPPHLHVVDESIYSDISLLAIFDTICLADGKISLKKISEMLYTFPELAKESVLLGKIEQLHQQKLITPVLQNGKIKSFEYLKKQLFFVITNQTGHYMGQYAENYQRMVASPSAKAWIGSGFLMISQDRLSEVKKRFMNFRNWMHSVDARALENQGKHKRLLFQFDMNLFSIIKDPGLLPGTLSEWAEFKEPNLNTQKI